MVENTRLEADIAQAFLTPEKPWKAWVGVRCYAVEPLVGWSEASSRRFAQHEVQCDELNKRVISQ